MRHGIGLGMGHGGGSQNKIQGGHIKGQVEVRPSEQSHTPPPGEGSVSLIKAVAQGPFNKGRGTDRF